MLHITNGEATRRPLERSGVPGTVVSWDDVLYQGRTVLAWGDEWMRVRAHHLASLGYGTEEEMLRDFRAKGDPLAFAGDHDEVVFWFEHDLHDQLLLIHHLWWLADYRPPATRFSIVIGTDYLGLLGPEQYPSRFAARRPIADDEIVIGAAAWASFCGSDPRALVMFTQPGGPLVYLPRAMRRLLEEFPSVENGLSRTERQILEVLAQGDRTPEQAFILCAKREEDIWLGDWSFWSAVRRLVEVAHPLVAAQVQPRPGGLPEGSLTLTDIGRQVLAGRADHVALNAPSRWIGGTLLTPERTWRWTGSSVQPPSL